MTKKQHYIPQFQLKEWVKNHKLKYYDINEKKHKVISKNKIKETFQEEYFYEPDTIDNVLEKKLSHIENDYAILIKKISENKSNKLKLKRIDLYLIKFWTLVSSLRSRFLLDRANNLEGDELFNIIYSNMKPKDIRSYFHNCLSKIIDKYFSLKKNGEIIEEEKLCDGPVGLMLMHLNAGTYLKFYRTKNEFIFPDSSAFQFINAKTSPSPLSSNSPMTSKVIVSLVELSQQYNFINKGYPQELIKKLNFPENFFTKDNAMNNYEDDIMKNEYVYNIVDLNEEQTTKINAFSLSQARNHIIYIEDKSIYDAWNKKEELNITRVEEE